MNDIKSNTREVYNTDSVIDVIVLDKGAKEFKRIKESTLKGYKSYVAYLTQTSTNAPVATVLKADFDVTWSYGGAGYYEGTVTLKGKPFIITNAAVFGLENDTIANGGVVGGSYIISYPHGIYGGNIVYISTEKSYASGGNLVKESANALMTSKIIEIRLYN